MTLVEFILILVIAALIGLIAQSLGGGYWRGGLLLAILLGFVGALVGSWLARRLGLPELLTVTIGGVTFPIVWAIIGAALVVGVASLLGRGGGRWWGITPPTRITLAIAILLAVLSLLVSAGIISVSIPAYTLMALAFLLLLLGNLIRGL